MAGHLSKTAEYELGESWGHRAPENFAVAHSWFWPTSGDLPVAQSGWARTTESADGVVLAGVLRTCGTGYRHSRW
jgi:hypothetical protein